MRDCVGIGIEPQIEGVQGVRAFLQRIIEELEALLLPWYRMHGGWIEQAVVGPNRSASNVRAPRSEQPAHARNGKSRRDLPRGTAGVPRADRGPPTSKLKTTRSRPRPALSIDLQNYHPRPHPKS